MRKPGSRDSKLETGISYLLITGVIISLSLEVAGIILLYRSCGNLDFSQEADVFLQGNNFFSFMFQHFRNEHGEGSAIYLMTAGIIALILTPYLRVIASVIYFGWQKDIKYVLITLFVLLVVTISLALH
jgi:uncharacterized membrane protein